MMMEYTQHYEAVWVPGLDDEIDPDESLSIAFAWLSKAERSHGGRGVVVIYAKKMVQNRPLLADAATRWEFVSPRSQSHLGLPRDGGPVLAIWPPDDRTLELAEQLAFRSALCVVPGSLYDISPWIERTGARCLVEGYAKGSPTELSKEVAESLRHMLFFGGHNGFLGGGEKEDAIRVLQEIAQRRDRPSREELEAYLRASGQTDGDGAQRAGKWYAEILAGKKHRDYRGRVIRGR
jgi:hypothetical protein